MRANRAKTSRMKSAFFVAMACAVLGCSSHPRANEAPGAGDENAGKTSVKSMPDAPLGPPLEFTLDPIRRDSDFVPASEQLRGKRAVVLILSSSDGESTALLMRLAPLLRDLPPDTTCMLVAMEPLENRMLAEIMMNAEDTPCLRAMADRTRGRLGDLAKVNSVPMTLVLRADGRAVGIAEGMVHPDVVMKELEKAK